MRIIRFCSSFNDRLSRNSLSEKVFNESKSYCEMHRIKVVTKLSWNVRNHQHRSIVTTKIKKKDHLVQSPLQFECFNKCSTFLKSAVVTFLKLAEKHFFHSHRMPKIFNHNKIKASCAYNIQQHIKNQNNYVQQKKKGNMQLSCNCRDILKCPLNGKCRTENTGFLRAGEVSANLGTNS